MPKALLHNLTIPYAHYDSGTFDFDQNAVFFAEPGDVVITRKKIPEAFLSFLKRIKCLSSDVGFISSKEDNSGPFSIFNDPYIIAQARRLVHESGREWIFDAYMITDWEARFAREIGLKLEWSPKQYRQFGGKSSFRKTAKRGGFPIPEGFEGITHSLEAASYTVRLFFRGFAEVVIKQNEGVAGLGSRRITAKEFIIDFFKCRPLLTKKNLGVLQNFSNFVIEGWYADVWHSPSVQLYISSEKQVFLISVHCQLFYENKMTYRGCMSYQWLPGDIYQKIIKEALEFGRLFSELGYRGHLSFNSILCRNGDFFWTEINPRRVSSSYPFQVVKRIGGGDLSGFFYGTTRVRKDSWKGATVERLLDDLGPGLYSPSKRKGLVPYDFGRLESHGDIYVLSIGSSREEVESNFQYAG